MLTKLKALWASLPHQVQALILLFLTVAATTLGKELQELFLGNEAFTWLMLKHDLVIAVIAGFAAVKMFYMFPNRNLQQGSNPQLPSSAPPPQS